MSVTRFGVSLDEELLVALDQYVTENSFSNRSQAIRYLVEKNLVEQKWKCGNLEPRILKYHRCFPGIEGMEYQWIQKNSVAESELHFEQYHQFRISVKVKGSLSSE